MGKQRTDCPALLESTSSSTCLSRLGINVTLCRLRFAQQLRQLGDIERDPNLASQMRVAFSSMVWNAGSNSPGEELITRSTSEVAVCC